MLAVVEASSLAVASAGGSRRGLALHVTVMRRDGKTCFFAMRESWDHNKTGD